MLLDRQYLGIVRVGDLSELVALAKLHLAMGVPRSDGVGVMSVSGGQAGAVADAVAAIGLPVPAIEPSTKARLDGILEFGEGFNPCDLTGEVARDATLAASVYAAFGDQADIGTVVYARKLLTGRASVDAAANLAREVGAANRAALVVYAMDGAIPEDEAEHYRDAGVSTFDSLHDLTTALAGLGEHRRRLERAAEPPVRPADVLAVADDLLAEIGRGATLDEPRAKRMVAAYGLSIPADSLATTEDEAVAAAESMGFPVVCKIVSRDIPHKSEAGGVVVGLHSAEAVRVAFRRIVEGTAGAFPDAAVDGVSVQQQAPPGVEMILGATVDPAFGPFVLLGVGGVFAEALEDVSLRPAPVTDATVRDMIDELRGRRLLDGFRGAPPADVAALTDAVVRLSWLAADHADRLDQIDLNPVVVLPDGEGARVLDALVIGRRSDK
jgi:acyl-CoA synthetase (NDP forming)